jgi:hypothetical protein
MLLGYHPKTGRHCWFMASQCLRITRGELEELYRISEVIEVICALYGLD